MGGTYADPGLVSPCGAASAVSLDRDDVGAPVPPQVRCDDISPAVLPGADEVLKLGNGAWLFQLLNCAIDPA